MVLGLLPANGLTAIEAITWFRNAGYLVALWHPTEKRLLWTERTFAKKTSADLVKAWESHGCIRYSFRLPPMLIVLDIDGEDAADRWREMQRKYQIHNTRIVRTPSGGLHVYLIIMPDTPIHHGVDRFREHGFPKVDVFSNRSGLITGPGSRREASGGKVAGTYRWCTRQQEVALATPELLADLIPPPIVYRPPAERREHVGDIHPVCQSILDDDLNKLATCSSGSRNKTLFSVSANLYAMAAAGEIPESGLEELLIQAATANGLANVKDTGIIGVRKTIASGKKHGWANPRCLESYRENYDRKRARGKNGSDHA